MSQMLSYNNNELSINQNEISNEIMITNDINTNVNLNNTKKTSKKRDRSPNNNLNDQSKKASNSQTNNNQNQNTSLNTTLLTNLNNTINNQTTVSISTNNNLHAQTNNSVNKKEKQRPETWNKIEQQIFFNALRQNGKNFEAITQYFNTRQKRYKIDAVQRSKEQIRHFYYRTWHKIIKYVAIPEDQPIRDIQVNCLIAFNALMNKSHRWNKKSALKLVELINHGWTTVRDKGKITRLRMPICKLTKNDSNNIESNAALPQLLNISLQPKNETAFCRVQKLAQNPFLLVDVQSTQTVKYLINYLENKWKERKLQFFEKINIDNYDDDSLIKPNLQIVLYPDESHGLSNLEIESNMITTTTTTTTAINTNNNDDEIDDQQNQNSSQPSISTDANNINNDQTSSNTSTNQQIKIRLKTSDENENQKQIKKTINEQHQQQSQPIVSVVVQPQQQLNDSNLNDSQIIAEEDETMLTSTEDEIEKEIELAIQTQTQTIVPSVIITPNNNNIKKLNPEKGKTIISKKQINTQSNIYRSQLNIDQLKAGLTNKSDLTFIQLYLALNKPNIIKLRYEWIPIKSNIEDQSSQPSSATIELIDKQYFYIQVLAKVAESYLSEIKTCQNETSNEAKPNNVKNDSNKKIEKSTTIMKTLNEPSQIASNETATSTQKLLQDMSSKARILRQRKAIVVKSTRGNRDSCESPTPCLMSPTTTTTTTTITTTSSTNTNIVVSAPVAAVARQIVNITPNTDFINNNQRKIQNTHQSAISYQNNQLINYQDQQPQKHILTMQQNYSNIIPQILTTFLKDNDNHNYNNCTYDNDNNNDISLNNIILQSNLILSDEQNLLPQQNSIQNHQQKHQNVDSSLIDITLNNDSVFGLNENSNMSSLSNLLSSLQCKPNVPLINNNLQESLQTQVNSTSNVEHSFIIPTTAISTSNTNNSTNIIQQYNGLSQVKSQTTTFKRSDTLEWNDCMSDISLNSFLNEMQSPEKKTLLNLLNENSRDSIFYNMDTIMDILPNTNRYDDLSTQNQNIMYKVNGQLIDSLSTTTTTSAVNNVYTSTTTTPISKN